MTTPAKPAPAAPAAPAPTPTPAPAPAPAADNPEVGSILEKAFGGAAAKTLVPPDPDPTPVAPTAPATPTPEAGVLDALNKAADPTPAAPTADPEEAEGLSDEEINKAPKHQQQALKVMNAKLKELRTKLKEAQKAASEAPTSAPLAEEVAKLRAQLEETKPTLENYEKELFISRLEATKRYQEAVKQPMEKIKGEVQGLAEKYKVDSRLLVEALAEADPRKRNEKLSELGGEMIEADRIDLYNYGREYAKLEANRQLLTQQSKEALEYIQAQEAAQKDTTLKGQKAEFESALSAHWERFQKELPILRHLEDNPEWNTRVDSIATAAKSVDIDALPQAQRAAMVLQALSMPHAVSVMHLYAQENLALKARLKQYEAIEPGARPAVSGSPTPAPEDDPGLSLVEVLKRRQSR